MMNEEIKNWIGENLQYSRGLICKKCNKGWFEKYDFLNRWEEIHKVTSFLNDSNPSFPQRIWHILNNRNIVTCLNPKCQNTPKFWSFNIGYLRTCSPSCAQYDPQTKEKIKMTNLKKYGVKYVFQNENVKEKCELTLKEKYGVKNISQVGEISDKKKETCFKNYGVEWFLQRQDIKEKIVNEKYGVDNVQQIPEIIERRIKTRRSNFYDTLFSTNRLKNKCNPLFTKEEYAGGGIEIKYEFQCNHCNEKFFGWLHDGDIPRCPTCYPSVGTSLFEKEVFEYVKSIIPNDVVEERNRNILSGNKELDIYIPSKNIAVECNGLFWHGEYNGNKSKTYHLDKTNECENKDIQLIHIFEDEWATKSDIVKSRLRSIIGNISIKIYARKCEIVEVTKEEKTKFLNEHHIQGNVSSTINIGLKFNNELLSIMTFGNRRICMNSKNNDNEYELLRYSTKKNVSIIGGSSKMLSYFIKKYNPNKIISYADRRWSFSKNNMYENIGFKKISSGTPNYWYFGKMNNYKRHHRFGFAKHMLIKRLQNFNPNLTEWENMKNNGWDRIWDCGNLKYEMIFPN